MFDVNDIEQVRKQGRPISINNMSNILSSLTIKAGVRQINHSSTGRERQPIPLAHGYRKFFTTQCINAKVNPEVREMLLNYSIGLASSYYRPTEDEILEEYMKAVDLLTINPENRLLKKVSVLQERNDRLDKLLDRIDILEKQAGIKI